MGELPAYDEKSALAGWAERRRSFLSVRVTSRRFGTVYRRRFHSSRSSATAPAVSL
jgi:hypothetical protein